MSYSRPNNDSAYIKQNSTAANTTHVYSIPQNENNIVFIDVSESLVPHINQDESTAFVYPNQEGNNYPTQNNTIFPQIFISNAIQQNQPLINTAPISLGHQGEEYIAYPDVSGPFATYSNQEENYHSIPTLPNNDIQQNPSFINTTQEANNIFYNDASASSTTYISQKWNNYPTQNNTIFPQTFISNAIKKNQPLINTSQIYSTLQGKENIASPDETAVYVTDMQQSQPKVSRKNSIASRTLYQDPKTKLLYLKPRKHENVASVRATLTGYFKKKIGNDPLTCNSDYRVICVTSNDQKIHNLIKKKFGGKVNDEPLSVDVYKHFINSNRYSKEIQTFFTNAMQNVIQRGQSMINTTPISLGHQEGEEYIAYPDVSEPFTTYPNQEENYHSIPNDTQSNPFLINTTQVYSTPQNENNIISNDVYESFVPHINQEENNYSIQNHAFSTQTFPRNDVPQHQPLMNKNQICSTYQDEENIASPDESALYFTDLEAQESGTELLNHSSLLGDHFDFSNPLSDNSISINAISSNSMTLFGNNGNAIKKRASEDNNNINSPPLKAAKTHITPSSY